MRRAAPLIAVLWLAAPACDGVWPASMEDQPSVGAHEGPRGAPEGTVAVGVPVVESREDVEDEQNPYAHDAASAVRGAHLFAKYCTACHGAKGDGAGEVSKVFPPAPDLRHYSICTRTDGFLFGTLTAGGRAMPTLREGLTARDRWDLVSYVRELQKDGCTGKPAETGDGDAGALDAGPPAGDETTPRRETNEVD